MKFYSKFTIFYLVLMLGTVGINLYVENWNAAIANMLVIGWFCCYRAQELEIDKLRRRINNPNTLFAN